MRAVDVNATIGPEGATIKLPRLSVIVETRQAERLRDVLNTVLPEQIEDLMHDPRVRDVHVLRAAQAILAERGQDTENLGVAIEYLNAQTPPTGDGAGGQPSVAPRVERRLHLLSIAGDVEPELSGAYDTEAERIEAARDYRRAHGDEDGLYRVDVTGDVTADVLIEAFSGAELAPLCILCRCDATGQAYGLPVCDYHADHSEDDPRCPHCLPQYKCARCEKAPAARLMQDVALCGGCDEVVRSVRIGDRVRDPLDGTWREIVGIDGLTDGGTCHMADGGCMSLDECAAAEKRLPSEELPS